MQPMVVAVVMSTESATSPRAMYAHRLGRLTAVDATDQDQTRE